MLNGWKHSYHRTNRSSTTSSRTFQCFGTYRNASFRLGLPKTWRTSSYRIRDDIYRCIRHARFSRERKIEFEEFLPKHAQVILLCWEIGKFSQQLTRFVENDRKVHLFVARYFKSSLFYFWSWLRSFAQSNNPIYFERYRERIRTNDSRLAGLAKPERTILVESIDNIKDNIKVRGSTFSLGTNKFELR